MAGPLRRLNPGSETSPAPWLIGATHVHSERTTDDHHTGSACLRLIATGKGDTLVNRLEVETNPAMTRGPYTVSALLICSFRGR